MREENHTSVCGLDRPSIERSRFHPFEFAFCGFSGSGKTTLLERIVPKLAPKRLGFLKSDAHAVRMDREGKDTDRLRLAGCAEVAIGSHSLAAHLVSGELSDIGWKLRWADCDALLIEGFRDSAIPKILVLDPAGEALEAMREGRFRGVRALVGLETESVAASLPTFHRDDIDGIARFVAGFWDSLVPAVKVVVLAGGESSRMGEDKAGIRYHGRTQAAHLVEIARSRGLEVRVSRAPGQPVPEGVDPEAVLEDRFLGFGPLGGILTALESDPASAWLAVGCDLPGIDGGLFDTILSRRDPFRDATAFLDSDGRFPEPMFSLWEPKSRLRALQFIGLGYRCPRKVLINSRIELLAHPGGDALFNANTPSDRIRAREWILERNGTDPRI